MALLLTRLFHCSNCHYTQPNREEQGREAQRDLSDFVAQDTKNKKNPLKSFDFREFCKGWLKSIFSSSHDFQPTHLPAIWPAVRLRRTSVFVCGGSLGGGAIHLPRAFEIPRGGAANGSETKKKDMTIGHVFLFGARGGSRTRTPLRALAPEASESTNSTTRANGEAERLSCSVQALYYHIPGQVSSLFLRDPVTFCFAHPPGREYA